MHQASKPRDETRTKIQRCGTLLVGKVDNMMFNQIIGSIDAVFAHFSQTSGVPAERLGHAMRVLGMNPTQDADLWQQLVLDSAPGHLRFLLWLLVFELVSCDSTAARIRLKSIWKIWVVPRASIKRGFTILCRSHLQTQL